MYGNDGTGGTTSFQQALERQRRSKAQREERRQNRIDELQSKEREKQDNMLKMLGLDAKALKRQKIKIARGMTIRPDLL